MSPDFILKKGQNQHCKRHICADRNPKDFWTERPEDETVVTLAFEN